MRKIVTILVIEGRQHEVDHLVRMVLPEHVQDAIEVARQASLFSPDDQPVLRAVYQSVSPGGVYAKVWPEDQAQENVNILDILARASS